MAHILAVYHHKKVLLVDGDKQGSASRYFGMYGEQAGTEALLMQLRDAAEVIYPTQYKGLDIITSNLELYKADRMMYDSEADEDMAMRLYVRLGYVKNDYDFCIIDNGPSVDTVTLNVLAAADDVLIPIRPDEFSFSGLLDLVEQVNGVREAVNAGLTLRGAFFTHWQNRETFAQAVTGGQRDLPRVPDGYWIQSEGAGKHAGGNAAVCVRAPVLGRYPVQEADGGVSGLDRFGQGEGGVGRGETDKKNVRRLGRNARL